jgi:hypothetical protein
MGVVVIYSCPVVVLKGRRGEYSANLPDILLKKNV